MKEKFQRSVCKKIGDTIRQLRTIRRRAIAKP
jgi:hypothetical protein